MLTLTWYLGLVLISSDDHNTIPTPGSLNNRQLFLTVLETRKSEIRVSAWSGSCKTGR